MVINSTVINYSSDLQTITINGTGFPAKTKPVVYFDGNSTSNKLSVSASLTARAVLKGLKG